MRTNVACCTGISRRKTLSSPSRAGPKVLDFGLAKRGFNQDATTETLSVFTAPGTVAGTPAYMSPEQLRGRPADARSDVWALGIVLHEMAAGARPFAGHTPYELSDAILNSPTPPLRATHSA